MIHFFELCEKITGTNRHIRSNVCNIQYSNWIIMIFERQRFICRFCIKTCYSIHQKLDLNQYFSWLETISHEHTYSSIRNCNAIVWDTGRWLCIILYEIEFLDFSLEVFTVNGQFHQMNITQWEVPHFVGSHLIWTDTCKILSVKKDLAHNYTTRTN